MMPASSTTTFTEPQRQEKTLAAQSQKQTAAMSAT
jgi:hypothetical protein